LSLGAALFRRVGRALPFSDGIRQLWRQSGEFADARTINEKTEQWRDGVWTDEGSAEGTAWQNSGTPLLQPRTQFAMATALELKLKDRQSAGVHAGRGRRTVSLADFKGKHVVLYFYPRDDTPGCTKEKRARLATFCRDQKERRGGAGSPV